MIIDLDGMGPFIETEDHASVLGVPNAFNSIVMEQIILFFTLLDLHLELSILFLLFDAHQLAQDVVKKSRICNSFTSLLHNLVEHFLQAYHIQGTLLEWEPHHSQHDHDEMLHLHLPSRQMRKFSLD